MAAGGSTGHQPLHQHRARRRGARRRAVVRWLDISTIYYLLVTVLDLQLLRPLSALLLSGAVIQLPAPDLCVRYKKVGAGLVRVK